MRFDTHPATFEGYDMSVSLNSLICQGPTEEQERQLWSRDTQHNVNS